MAASMAPPTTPVILLTTTPAAPLIPLAMPCTICEPMEATRPGMEDRALMMELPILEAAEITKPTAPRMAEPRLLIPLRPMLARVDGRFWIAPRIADTMLAPHELTKPAMPVMPLPRNVMAFLPRLGQSGADHAETKAEKMAGMLAMSVGIACTMPSASVTIAWMPAPSSIGALSLIALARFCTMTGACSMSVGRLSAIPCAKPTIRFAAPSARTPAFSAMDSERPVRICRPLSVMDGRFSDR